MHFILIFIVFLHSLLIGLVKETFASSDGDEKMFHLRIDTFIIIYLYVATMIPDIIIHLAKNRNSVNKNVWVSKALERSKKYSRKPNNRALSWLESLERLNLEQGEEEDNTLEGFQENEYDKDKSSREVDFTEADEFSLDSTELKTLTEQRFSAISSHFTMTPADIAAAEVIEDPDLSDTMSWMSFYDQESPFFTVSTLEKYTQFSTLFHPFKPKQLIRNRIALWIHFLQKWHKVQLRGVRTYRLLYAFWWKWQELDIDMSLLQKEMNKMHDLVLQFQNTGQKIRDLSIWLEPHPLWRMGIELPHDEKLIAP
jgi:hypothetical protein